MKAANLNYSDIRKGDVYAFDKKLSKEDVINFANLTGDLNPLHVDEEFGRKSVFNRNIVHGMLTASLFSTLVGMHCPGEKCLYLSQTLNFRSAVFYDDTVTVKGTVMSKNDSIKLITLKTEIIKAGKIVIIGEAKIKMLED